MSITKDNMTTKEKNNSPKMEIVASGEQALKVAEALTATTMKMLRLLWQEPLDVSTIGKRLGLSEAYISEQVKLLEELKLLNVTYAPGKRGIRKICSSAIVQVTLLLK
jgi:predicted transcriptional regulator